MSDTFADLQLPSEDDIGNQIKRAKHSSPGRDGIPNAAWQADLETAVKTIHPVSQAIAEEIPPADFNDSNVVFAPKGKEQSNSYNAKVIQLTRTPGTLRTIFLLNADNKYVSGALNRIMIKPTLSLTPSNQRGFCPGRQFVLNIVVLDLFARIFNILSGVNDDNFSAPNCPVLALFDICNAFPSVAHVWLFSVLQCIKLNPFVFSCMSVFPWNWH